MKTNEEITKKRIEYFNLLISKIMTSELKCGEIVNLLTQLRNLRKKIQEIENKIYSNR